MKKILIVDDNEDIALMVTRILVKRHYDVLINTTGMNIPEIVNIYKPQLILLDITLPGIKGTDICKELKQKYTVPVILVSAHPMQEELISKCKADGYIQKPFHMDDILTIISSKINAAIETVS